MRERIEGGKVRGSQERMAGCLAHFRARTGSTFVEIADQQSGYFPESWSGLAASRAMTFSRCCDRFLLRALSRDL